MFDGQERADYGQAHVRQLARDLTCQFGSGFGSVNLSQPRRFYLEWPEQKILQTRLKLPWALGHCLQISFA
jgi:hypothetical protein